MAVVVTGMIGKLDFLPGWEGSPLVDDLAREFGLTVAWRTNRRSRCAPD